MENVIQQIIDIDQRAQQKYIDAEDYKKRAEQIVNEEKQRIDAQLLENSKEKLDALQKSQTEIFEEKRRQLLAGLEAQKKVLEQIYQDNHRKWEQDLFQKVLQG